MRSRTEPFSRCNEFSITERNSLGYFRDASRSADSESGWDIKSSSAVRIRALRTDSHFMRTTLLTLRASTRKTRIPV